MIRVLSVKIFPQFMSKSPLYLQNPCAHSKDNGEPFLWIPLAHWITDCFRSSDFYKSGLTSLSALTIAKFHCIMWYQI